MSKVISIATADAPTRVDQGEVREFAREIFSKRGNDIDRLLNVFSNTSVQSRHFTEDKPWYGQDHGFAERNRLYVERSVEMCALSAKKCLDAVGLAPKDVEHVIFISSTGLSTPSIDAILFNILGFNNHVKRTPIWGIGCAGGAVGLSRALDYTRASQRHSVLVIAIELCGLTFQKDDYSKSNIVGTSLFADGAASALVAGDEHPLHNRNGILLLDSLSTIYPNSLDVMGWEVKDAGLKVIFSRDIPTIVCENVKENIEELVGNNKLALQDIKHYVVHPGGQKVMDAYQEALGLMNDELRFSRKVLREHGNMSSPTVLYVLKEFVESREYNPDEYGLISALGPGFSSELMLFKVN